MSIKRIVTQQNIKIIEVTLFMTLLYNSNLNCEEKNNSGSNKKLHLGIFK